jgi:uncharacterized protein (DUF362 family)
MPSKHCKKEQGLTRRELLVKTAATCGAAAGVGIWGYLFYSNNPVRGQSDKIFTFNNYRVPASKVHPDFLAVTGRDIEKMAAAALDKLGGISRFISPGDRVMIKPNVGWDRQPEQAANTNPELVGAVVRLCLSARAAEVWVSDVPINDPYRSFSRSGIEKAVLKSGGTVKFTTEDDFVPTDLKGQVLRVWPVSSFYHQVDKLINMPVVKHHSLSKCTIAMKNWYGVLGGRRNRLHQDINTSIADLATAIRPTLTITDATRVLMRNGPTGGNLSDVSVQNTIVAGLDEIALDSYCLGFLGLHADDIPFLVIGEKRGLGTADWKSLNYVELNV